MYLCLFIHPHLSMSSLSPLLTLSVCLSPLLFYLPLSLSLMHISCVLIRCLLTVLSTIIMPFFTITIILCIIRFAQGLRLRQVDMITDDIAASSATLTRMAKHMRNVCVEAVERMRRKRGQRLGGRREFVAIDESHFRHKRKVNANTIHIIHSSFSYSSSSSSFSYFYYQRVK